jgi:hypothetical protein
LNRKLKAKIIEEYGTQVDFADAIDADETFVSRVVRGRRNLDPKSQFSWAKALGCKPKDIFSDEN